MDALCGDVQLTPRSVAVAARLWPGGEPGPARAPLPIDFERRFGPLVVALRHWRRARAGRCVRAWRAATLTGPGPAPPAAARPAPAPRALPARVRLRPWWQRWQNWHRGRRERREQVAEVWTALRLSNRLRAALAEWRRAAAAAAAEMRARERQHGARYWLARWCRCAEEKARLMWSRFVAVEHRRQRSVARQWLRQARRRAVASQWRYKVAAREGSRHLRRRALLRWCEAAHHACRPQLAAAAVMRQSVLRRQCWAAWSWQASCVALLRDILAAWREVAAVGCAVRHCRARRACIAFAYWGRTWLPRAQEAAAERVRQDIFVLAYVSGRRAREAVRLQRAAVSLWLRYCNDRLAKRTALALARQFFQERLWERISAGCFGAWRIWANRQVCAALAAKAATEFCRRSVLRRCCAKWRRRQAWVAARRRRIAMRKLVVAHRSATLVEQAMKAWRGWVATITRLMLEATSIADGLTRRRRLSRALRRWRRRAHRTARFKEELARLHLHKTRTRMVMRALRQAVVDAGKGTQRSAAAATPVPLSPGLHGLMPPSSPRTERSRLRDRTNAQPLSLGRLGTPQMAPCEPAPPTSWAKHVADRMGQFEADAGEQDVSAVETTFDYVSVSSVSSASSEHSELVWSEPRALAATPECPDTAALASAVLGAVDAVRKEWRRRWLCGWALRRWSHYAARQAEALARILDAHRLAAFHRVRRGMSRWRAWCLSSKRGGGGAEQKSTLLGSTAAPLSPWEDRQRVARAIAILQ